MKITVTRPRRTLSVDQVSQEIKVTRKARTMIVAQLGLRGKEGPPGPAADDLQIPNLAQLYESAKT